MTNASALRKGAPPQRETTTSPIAADPRPPEGKNKPLQLMVPPDVFNAFSARAGTELGYTKALSRGSSYPCGNRTYHSDPDRTADTCWRERFLDGDQKRLGRSYPSRLGQTQAPRPQPLASGHIRRTVHRIENGAPPERRRAVVGSSV
jgi:hypothetical protein